MCSLLKEAILYLWREFIEYCCLFGMRCVVYELMRFIALINVANSKQKGKEAIDIDYRFV